MIVADDRSMKNAAAVPSLQAVKNPPGPALMKEDRARREVKSPPNRRKLLPILERTASVQRLFVGLELQQLFVALLRVQ